MLHRTPKTTLRSTIAYQWIILCTATALGACAETTTVKIPVSEFIALNSHEAQSSSELPIVTMINGKTRQLTGPIEEFRLMHESEVLMRVVPPVSASSDGSNLRVVTAKGQNLHFSNVSHVAIDYSKTMKRRDTSSFSGRKVAGIMLLTLGMPVLLVSTGLFLYGLSHPSEGAIPILFVSPMVSLGSMALVVPGLYLVSTDEPKQRKDSVWIRPTLQVLPNGVVMTAAF
jgi:hypothetical protein